MGAGAAVVFSDLPAGAKVLGAPPPSYSDLPAGAKVLPSVPGNAPGTITGNVAEMRAVPGEPPPSRPYQGPGIERAESYMGENLRNFGEHPLDAIRGALQPLEALDSTSMARDVARGVMPQAIRTAPDIAIGLIHRYQTDPAAAAGDAGTAALLSTLTGKPPGVNLADISASETIPSGIAHPWQGLVRGVKSLPEPDLLSAIRHPISSAAKTAMALPDAIKAGLGEDIRIQPVARPAPAWQTSPAAGTLVDSVLNRQPYAQDAVPRPVRLIDQMGGQPVESITQPSGDSLLDRIRGYAANIEAQGHGEETAMPQERTPQTTNLNEDLTPALKASLRKVRLAKAARSVKPN